MAISAAALKINGMAVISMKAEANRSEIWRTAKIIGRRNGVISIWRSVVKAAAAAAASAAAASRAQRAKQTASAGGGNIGIKIGVAAS
jgi:1,2-phenylacetyl-CoA epoxidase PaaB subunit